jgi:hypothetical protein
MIRFELPRRRCGTMDRVPNYLDKTKYTLTIDGQKIPITWKPFNKVEGFKGR